MPVRYVDWYTRPEIKANRDCLYVFGDNYAEAGYGGQAREARDEPNAVGIYTKRAPSWNERAFLTDADFPEWLEKTNPAFNRIEYALGLDQTVIWPSAGIGTYRAQLHKRAPLIFAHIGDWLQRVCIEFNEPTQPPGIRPIGDLIAETLNK